MSDTYSITINMDPQTVGALIDGKYKLYAFKGVDINAAGAQPTIWFNTDNILAQTTISWTEDYQAYVSNTHILDKVKIFASSSVPILLKQIANVAKAGIIDVVDGQQRSINLNNVSDYPFTSGISQRINGMVTPLCAVTLYGNQQNAFVPRQKVLLMFGTATFEASTVIFNSFSQSMLIDLTGATKREVKYDINKGWDTGGQVWCKTFAASSPLHPILFGDSLFASQTLVESLLIDAKTNEGTMSNGTAFNQEIAIAPHAEHTFNNLTVDQVTIDNRHNVRGFIRYQIGSRPAITMPLIPYSYDQIHNINGQQLQVWNDTSNTIYVCY